MLIINQLLQQHSSLFADCFFKAVSFLMTDIPIVIVLSYIYWCINKDKAFKAGIILLSSMQINFLIKNIFKVDRPYVKDKSIINKDVKYGYGYSFPSNHSQMSSTILFSVKEYFSIKKGYIFGIIFICLVAASRMYLGVHSILDVIVGLVLGYVICKLIAPLIDKIILTKKYYLLYLFAILGILGTLLFGDKDSLKILLLYFGFVTGYLCEIKFIDYKIPKKLYHNIINYIIGILGVALIYIFLIDSLKYFAIGIWITLGAPFVFIRKDRIKWNLQKSTKE